MSTQLLQHSGVVAVCFSCATEKKVVFGSCSNCGLHPKQEDEITDSLVLSRYASTELLLTKAVAERSPGVVLKVADRSTMRGVAKALRDPQLRQLLGLESNNRSVVANAKSSHAASVERLVQFAQAEAMSEAEQGLESSLASEASLTVWAKNEQLLQGLRSEVAEASTGVLLEMVEDVAQRCSAIDDKQLKSYLLLSDESAANLSKEERRDLWTVYEKSLLDRIVVSLERASTETLIDLFQRLQISAERRRDKQALPLVKSLLAVYQTHAISTLRLESNNASRLISAIRTCGVDEEQNIIVSMANELEALVANWRKVAGPLAGKSADREVAGIRREMQRSLQNVADYLSEERQDSRLSERFSRLALELL